MQFALQNIGIAGPLIGIGDFFSKRFAVLKYKNYRLFFIGLSFSRIGDAMQFIASSWLVMRLGHSASCVLILAACRSLPALVAGPFLGVVIDVSNRRRAIILTDMLLGCITCSVPVLWWLGKLENWHVYGATILMTTGRDFWIALSRSLVRQWIPESMLLEANSTVSIANQTGVLCGGVLGGLVVMKSSEATVMLINGFTFFLSACCLALARDSHRPETPIGMLHQSASTITPVARKRSCLIRLAALTREFWHTLADGWNFLLHNRGLRYAYAAFLVYFLRLPLANALLPIYTSVALRGSAGSFAALDAADGMGGIMSALFLPALSRLFGEKMTILGGVVAISAALVCLGLSHHFWLSLAINFAIGFLFHVWVLFLTATQRQIPLSLQGRVHSLFDFLVQLLALLLFALIGSTNRIPIRPLYVIHGCVALPLICYLVSKAGIFAKDKRVSYVLQ